MCLQKAFPQSPHSRDVNEREASSAGTPLLGNMLSSDIKIFILTLTVGKLFKNGFINVHLGTEVRIGNVFFFLNFQ